MVEEEVGETTVTEESSAESVVSEEAGGEEEEISVNVVMLETMFERLAVLEKLAKGEITPREALELLAKVRAPEVEKRRRRRRK